MATREQIALPLMRKVGRTRAGSRALDVMMRPFNPFDPALDRDPYPTYDTLRARGPVVRHRGLNSWLLTSFDACDQALRSSATVSRDDFYRSVGPWSHLSDRDRSMFTESLIMIDGPKHARLRKLVARAFTPRAVAGLGPRIEALATSLLETALRSEVPDLQRDVFDPLPLYVIGEQLGVPEHDRPLLEELSGEFAKFLDPIGAFDALEMAAAVQQLDDALARWVDGRRGAPGDDLLGALVQAGDTLEGGAITTDELRSLVAVLITAGHETTSKFLGNAFVALSSRPEHRRVVEEDPTAIEAAVDELLRFDSPVQTLQRIATEDMEICGVKIRRGDPMMLLLGAANRDPRRFPRPDRLDFTRANDRLVAFGFGAHHCVGAALARRQAQVVLPVVCRELAGHRLVDEGIRWAPSLTLRGPAALPIAPCAPSSQVPPVLADAAPAAVTVPWWERLEAMGRSRLALEHGANIAPLAHVAMYHGALATAVFSKRPLRLRTAVPGVALLQLLNYSLTIGVLHMHSHRPLFTRPLLNRAVDLGCCVPSFLSETEMRLVHVQHHHKFDDGPDDVTSTLGTERGAKAVGYWVRYGAVVKAFTVRKVFGRDVPERLRQARRRFVVDQTLTALYVAALIRRSPRRAAVFYLLPLALTHVSSGFFAWLTHAPAVNASNEVSRSLNNVGNLLALVIFNQGYHSVHHRYPGIHWTEIPDRLDVMRDVDADMIVPYWMTLDATWRLARPEGFADAEFGEVWKRRLEVAIENDARRLPQLPWFANV